MDFKQKTVLGRTGLSVSRLGLAGGYGIDRAGTEKAYFEYGVNFFYWGSMRRSGMGDALKGLASSDREKIVILLQTYDHLGFSMKRSIRNGAKKLGIDYVDIALLGYFNKMPSNKILDKAHEMKDSGLVRHIAMSSHNRKLFGQLAADKNSPIDIFMTRYNAVHKGAEEDIFPFLDENKDKRPGVMAYTATCWGKLLKQKKMPEGETALTAADCYRFALSNDFIDVSITGPRNMAQMDEGFRALEQGPLSEEEIARIRRIGDKMHG